MFKISCAPEMYKPITPHVLEGCEEVKYVCNNITVHGQTMEMKSMTNGVTRGLGKKSR